MVYNPDTSVLVMLSSNTLLIVASCVVLSVLVLLVELGILESRKRRSTAASGEKKSNSKPPGPRPYPIIGNLACLDGYEVPYQAFDDLAKQYGPIISLRLGSVPTVVVNGIDNIKEVLITKASHFDSRPNFKRYHELFKGNKQNCKYFLIIINKFHTSKL